MFKSSILMFVIFLIGTSHIVNAKTEKPELSNAYDVKGLTHSLPGNCPSAERLIKNKEWVEHTGPWNKNLEKLLAVHFNLPITPVKPAISLTLLPVNVDRGMGISQCREIVWAVHRTNQTNFSGENNNCHVLGTVAYYVEVRNQDGWPPKADFANKSTFEKQWLQKRVTGLIEFRWYDPVEQRRHRWFNRRLAYFMKWVKANKVSPIFLPRVINSLE